MKLVRNLILICLLSQIFSVKIVRKLKSRARPTFLNYTAVVIGGGFIKNSVRIYNNININEGHRIYRARNGLTVHPTGQIRKLQTPKGERTCHRLLDIDRKNLTDPKTEGGRSQDELWIPSEHLNTFSYPIIKGLDRIGIVIPNSNDSEAACWNWALIGDLNSVNDSELKRYDDIYGKISIKLQRSGGVDVFKGLAKDWNKMVPLASLASKNLLEQVAIKVIDNEQNFDWTGTEEIITRFQILVKIKKNSETY